MHGAQQLKLTSSPFYSGHATHESIQLRRIAHGASTTQFEELNYSTHTHNSGHAIHIYKKKRAQNAPVETQAIKIKKKKNEYLLKGRLQMSWAPGPTKKKNSIHEKKGIRVETSTGT